MWRIIEATQKWLPGWKVIYTEHGWVRKSVVAEYFEGGIQYPKMQEVTPQWGCGPLAVFTSYEDAVYFCRKFSDVEVEIVPCAYVPSTKKQMWYKLLRIRITKELTEAPPGTALAEKVFCFE